MDFALSSSASGASASPSLIVHRLRFLDWTPSAITALAFSPCVSGAAAVSKPNQRSILAIGRENGNVDLCVWVQEALGGDGATADSSGLAKGWVVDTTLVGAASSKIDSLAFILSPSAPNDSGYAAAPTPRLFSSSGGAVLTEHFLPLHLLSHPSLASSSTTAPSAAVAARAISLAGTTRTLNSNGGAIWSMAASPLGRYIALGCEDGCVRIVDVAEGRFEHLAPSRAARRKGDGRVTGVVAKCDRAKTRVVSLAWGPPTRRQAAKAQQKKSKKMEESSDDSDDSSDDDSDDEDAEAWEDSFILGGTSSSLALMWDVRTGRISARLNVDRARHEHTVVWACAVLPDSTVVLGDSTGRVTFYDARTHTPLPGASFTAHSRGADVLCLTPGPDGRSLYAAGVDQRVSEYARIGAKWIHTANRRLHAHDVKALAIEPALDLFAAVRKAAAPARLPVLVSGGADFNIVLTPAASPSGLQKRQPSGAKVAVPNTKGDSARDIANPISSNNVTSFADTTQRRVAFVPGTARGGALGGGSVVCAAPGRRWLALRRERSIGIWALPLEAGVPEEAGGVPRDDGEAAEAWRKVLEMELKCKTNLVALAVSPDGKWLAVSDLYETKLFSLRAHGEGLDVTLEPKREKSLAAALAGANASAAARAAGGCSALTFTPDSSRLVMASFPGSYVHIVELPTSHVGAHGGVCKLLRSFAQHRQRASGRSVAGKTPNGTHDASEDDEELDAAVLGESTARDAYARIDVLAISPDSQYLLSIDTSRRVHTFNLDVLSAHRALPSPAHVPTHAAFDTQTPSRVALVLPTNRVALYDVESGKSVDASLERAVRAALQGVRDAAVGAVWLPGAGALVVWGPTWLCTARAAEAGAAARKAPHEKRRREDASKGAGADEAPSPWTVKLTHKYQPLLYVDALAKRAHETEQEIVVVERPFFALARNLPPAFRRPAAYGQ